MQVTLDGQPAGLIDVYGAASCGQVLFSSTGLTNGRHSIHLELSGESPNVTSFTDGPARLFVFTNFMHVFFQSKLIKMTVAAGFFTFLVLIIMTLSDYMSRAWGLW